MPTRLRKTRRFRGSRTHGYGQIGQHRHSGKQGGHGNAGLHKHKWSWVIKYDPNHFGRDPFRTPHPVTVTKWLNVGDLDELAKTVPNESKLDLTLMGIQRLLGSGEVKGSYTVKVRSITERAKIKIEKAGGNLAE
jgi:large subunit ribosomal protein L15